MTDVSLIMPVWRTREDWLRQAVGSVLEERGCDLELIVVDDGSEQPAENLLADIGDGRLRHLRVEHGGPYAARNAGIAVASGRFVRFVDSDDVVARNSTARLLDRSGDSGEISYGATEMCDEALTPLSVATSRVAGDAAEECLMGRFHVYVVSMLFPRAVVEAAGPWNENAFRVSGDWDFVLRALEQAAVRPLDEVVTRYRRHAASVTKTADVAAGVAAGETVLGGYFARHPELRGSRLERRAYVRLHLDRASAHAWLGESRPAARQLWRAARRDPAATLAACARRVGGRLRSLIARVARRRGHAPTTRA
ncbi:MAG TPA: glycosyltransferase [Thermoleophilaceae bacterium]